MQFAKGSPGQNFVPNVPVGVMSGNMSVNGLITGFYIPGFSPGQGAWQIFSVAFAVDSPSNLTLFPSQGVTPDPAGAVPIFTSTDGIGKTTFGMTYTDNGIPHSAQPDDGIAVSVSHAAAFLLYYNIVFGRPQ